MAQIAPPLTFQAFNDDGSFMVGGLLYTYAAGTSTPKATYTSFSLGAANTNPVVLDARGSASVWMDGNYRFVLHDADDVLVKEQDDVRDLTSSATFTNATLAGTLTVSSTAVTWSGNPTHSGNHTFTNNVVINGNTTLGDASTDTLTIRPNAVTWTNGVTHAGANTFTDEVVMNGAVTLGNGAGDAVSVNGTTTHGGPTEFVGAVTVSTSSGELRHGKYTPTLTNSVNVASSTAREHRWIRLGDYVIINGSVSVTPTAAAGTATQLGIALPIASNLSTIYDIRSPAAPDTTLGNATAFVSPDTANDRAILNFEAGSTSACGWSYTIMYEVK